MLVFPAEEVDVIPGHPLRSTDTASLPSPTSAIFACEGRTGTRSSGVLRFRGRPPRSRERSLPDRIWRLQRRNRFMTRLAHDELAHAVHRRLGHRIRNCPLCRYLDTHAAHAGSGLERQHTRRTKARENVGSKRPYWNWNQFKFAPLVKTIYKSCTPDAPLTDAVTVCQVCQPPVAGRVTVATGAPERLSR